MESHELEIKQTSVSKYISAITITEILDRIIRMVKLQMKGILDKKIWSTCTTMCINIDLLTEANTLQNKKQISTRP